MATALLRPESLWDVLPEALQAIAFCSAVGVLKVTGKRSQQKRRDEIDDGDEGESVKGIDRLDGASSGDALGGGSSRKREGEKDGGGRDMVG